MPNKCQNGDCVNTEGSYTCECNSGYAKSWRGQCEGDMHAHTGAYAHIYFTKKQNISQAYLLTCILVTKHILSLSQPGRQLRTVCDRERDLVFVYISMCNLTPSFFHMCAYFFINNTFKSFFLSEQMWMSAGTPAPVPTGSASTLLAPSNARTAAPGSGTSMRDVWVRISNAPHHSSSTITTTQTPQGVSDRCMENSRVSL